MTLAHYKLACVHWRGRAEWDCKEFQDGRISCRAANLAPSKYKSYFVPSFEPWTFQNQVVFCAEIRTMHLPNSSHTACRVSKEVPSKFNSYFVPRFEPCTFQIQFVFCAEIRTMDLPNSSHILCRDSNHASSKFKSYCVPSFEGNTFQIQFVFCAEIRTMHLPNQFVFCAEIRTMDLPHSSRILCRDSNHASSKFNSYFVPSFDPCTFQIQVVFCD